MKQLWEKVKRLKPYRANQRYNEVRGNVLSAGIAYYAFFSVFPAFAIAAVVFGFVLRGNPELLTQVSDALEQRAARLRQDAGQPQRADHPRGAQPVPPHHQRRHRRGHPGALGPRLDRVLPRRDPGRLGAQGSPGNLLTDKLRDLGVFTLQGPAFLVSAVLTSVLAAASGWIAERVGLGERTFLVQIAGYLVGYVIDVAILVLLLRVLSGVDAAGGRALAVRPGRWARC